jgi:hypothetical protein
MRILLAANMPAREDRSAFEFRLVC